MLMIFNDNRLTVNGLPVLFLCDQKRCDNWDKCLGSPCFYTTDITHAKMTGEKTFREHDGGYWEDVKLAEVFNH